MRIAEPARGRRGSAIVLAMLLLVLLSAIGMYAVSLPVSVAEGSQHAYRSAVARNMARAGMQAAIARLPAVSAGGAPYIRQFPAGPDATGRYSVTTRRTGGTGVASASAGESGLEDYLLVSEGSASGDFPTVFRVRAVVRYRASRSSAPRVQVLKWEETASQ
jgi:hypothetical protein